MNFRTESLDFPQNEQRRCLSCDMAVDEAGGRAAPTRPRKHVIVSARTGQGLTCPGPKPRRRLTLAHLAVIPAKARVQTQAFSLDPGFRRDDGFNRAGERVTP